MIKLLVIIDTTVGGMTGGAETHIWNLLSRLDQSRYEVDVIYFDTEETEHDVVDNTKEVIEGVNYYRIPIRRVYSPFSFKYLREIYQTMKNGNYDCVMSLFESSDVVVATLGRMAGIKIRISNRRDTGFRNSKKLSFAYSIINKNFTGFIAVSNAVKESILAQGVSPEKIKIVHNAVDIRRFENANGSQVRRELGIESDAMVFGLVANLHPVKNHVAIIDALSDLHKHGKQAHLILAGDGELRHELETQVERLDLAQYVHILGARSDIENLLDSIDVFVLASHTEGLSNALLEAMASKKPVIATRVGGNLDVIEDGVNGLLVSTESSSIAEAMEKLMESEKIRDEIGQNAFIEIQKRFSLEQMMSLYTRMIKPSSL